MGPLPHEAPAASPRTGDDGAAGLVAMLLADGRFPAGGHAHSAGAEAACADGRITDVATLGAFVEGRLHTAGLVDAALAAATVVATGGAVGGAARDVLAALDAEADARIAPPPLRAASRKLGRQLVRVAGRCWPDPVFAVVADAAPAGAHQTVALGTVGVAAGLGPIEVARLAVHHAVSTPAQAAVRLLGLDPFEVAALAARLAPSAAGVAAAAVAAARRAAASGDLADLADLPARSGPLVEVAAIVHRTWDVRMFAT